MAQDGKPAIPVGNDLDNEQINAVGGGLSCDAEELVKLSESLTMAYDNLVNFVSHVIERVAGQP